MIQQPLRLLPRFTPGPGRRLPATGSHRGLSKKDAHSRLCVFCDSDHQSECKIVSDITTRISNVKKKGLCFNGLSKTHQAGNCPSRFRCRTCKGKHHTSESSQKLAQFNSNSEISQSEDSSHSLYNEGAAILHASSMATHSNVLLKTTVSPICACGRYADANILIDEGAHMSFISQKLADTLHLQRDGSDVINLSSFGYPAHSVKQLDTVTIHLVATDGEVIPIRVLIVPVISKPIANRCRQSVTDLQYLRGLRLAHPVTLDDTFEISLLIGGDFYWQIVGDETARGDGPTAVNSRIGYLLSEPLPASTGKTSHGMDVIAAHVSDTPDPKLLGKELISMSAYKSITDANKSKRKHDNQLLLISKKHVKPRAENLSFMTCEPNRNRSITSAVATTLLQDPENTSTYTH